MRKTILTVIILFVALLGVNAQSDSEYVYGSVVDRAGEPVIGAEVLWIGTTEGVLTFVDGSFEMEKAAGRDTLVVLYLGYKSDTVVVSQAELPLNITMYEEATELDEVNVTATGPATFNSRITTIQTTKITGAELCRAACCNLSESFETNASVDVAYSDAATGAKQIKMLGLSGIYVQLLAENAPSVRGLAQNFGMEYIPGSWMESIQVSKGTSSVINGFEATTGQINIEYIKPWTGDYVTANGVMNSMLGGEVNITGCADVDEHWSTGTLAHYKGMWMEHDANGDGFKDLPNLNEVNLLHRWYYKKGDHTSQYIVRGLYDERDGGTMSKYHGDKEREYEIGMEAWRVEALVKQGVVFDKEQGTSIGLILGASYHKIDNSYGQFRRYQGGQGNINFNGIFQSNFGEAHKLSTGVSVIYDDYEEHLDDNSPLGLLPDGCMTENGRMKTDRWEVTPGIFAEYSYKYGENLSVLLGARVDYSTKWGFFATPRFNVRYSPWEWWAIRASVGLGYRSPNILTDYAQFLSSSRQIVVREEIKQERAMNAGVSMSFYIPIADRELQITGDYYYTHFMECMVADMDIDPHKVVFHNLDGGKSYSHNVQVEASMEILKGWNMTLAYRWCDVKVTTNGELREKALTGRFKGLITTSYTTPLRHWQFDFTAQFNGGGRMPDPGEEQLWKERYGWYPQLMAQITRYFKHNWSVYLGAENMTNFTQKEPIVAADQPYSRNFDASMPWGPIDGWKVYAGFRWALKR